MAYSFPDAVSPADLLADLLAISLTGVNLLRPLYGSDGALEDFALEYLNPAAQRMTGLGEQPGGTTRARFPDIFQNGVFEFYRRVVETGEAGRYSFNYQADGFDNYFHVAARCSGELLVVSFTDTSDQPRSAVEIALRESQAREQAARAEAERQRGELTRLFEQAPVAIAVFRGADYSVELANDRHLALWGRTRPQVLNRPLFEAIPEVAGRGYEELLAGVLTTGEPYVARESSAPLVRYGVSEEVYFNFVYQPLYEADGQISGVVVVASDITEQVRSRQQVQQLNQELEARVQARTQEVQLAQQATETERQRLHQVLMALPANLALLRGPAHAFELVNPRYQQLFPTRSLLGQPLREALPELAGQGFLEAMHEVYTTGQPLHLPEAETWADFAGTGRLEQRYYSAYFLPFADGQGLVTYLLNVAFDITPQVLARQQVQDLNRELYESNTQLLRANAELDTFVYTASHDLKSPITNIEGLINALQHELAASDPEGGIVAHLLQLMRDSVARFQRTLGHLTDLTRLEQAGAGPREEIDLGALVEGVRLDLAPAFEASKGQLQVDFTECPRLHHSPRDMRSIFFNLMSNALKYCPPDRPPVVQVSARCHAQQAVLTVQDNGLGMSSEQQARLFQLFQRLHPHVDGSGVGLYAIKKLIDNAGGTIEVTSEVGVGSLFTVRLPL